MKKKEKFADVGSRILVNCRNELYRYFPYLDGAFASLEYESSESKYESSGPKNKKKNPKCNNEKFSAMWTDGEKLYFSPDILMRTYMENPSEIKRGYLHILLHCLYFHLFPVNANMDKRIWSLACDMAVEYVIEQTVEKEMVVALETAGEDLEKACLKRACFEKFAVGNVSKASSAVNVSKVLAAEQIYSMLVNNVFPYSLQELEEAFAFDDHSRWELCSQGERAARLRRKWERVASYTVQNKQNGQNRRGNRPGEDWETLDELRRGRYDYRRFLKKFAIPREEVELDTESFDYIFYHYGMEHYGNLPLIEPLEYKEVNRLEELVIAIDTSGSCSKEMVQKFLDETYRIFSEKENFFRKMKVHILQCDCHLQDVAVIHSDEEWKEYSKNVVIQGRSGTNFRPVFRYVEEQREKKEIKNLKALIYFTDGDGVFPEKTDYETAFVFVKKCECMDLIPSWITKLLIYQEG